MIPSGERSRPDAPVVLVGIMGAGKTTVGRRLARRCGGRFIDLDDEIVRRSGRTVPEIFAGGGEAEFRRLEADATREIPLPERSGRPLIVAAGGGWMANREARSALPDARIVWLRVGPSEAARRLARHVGERPLLDGPDLEARLRRLLAERLPAYGEASYTVDTDGRTPEHVAEEIEAAVGDGPRSHERSEED